MSQTLKERLQDQPYQGYAYAYPHKTAYRHFDEPIPLRDVWKDEDKTSLYLYVHLPFCEMRCGFCNLFTTTNPKGDRVSRYLDALEIQMDAAIAEICNGGDTRFARAAFGGGTPSFLIESELSRLFDSLTSRFGEFSHGMPMSFELSPGTVTQEKLSLLKSSGITRISIGVQSFIEEETKAFGRPQSSMEVASVLSLMRGAGFPVMNIDLIYGAENQSIESWLFSLKRALEYCPEELYLYPLYVRPLTGLEKIGRTPADHRIDLYRAGRDFLRENGYKQISMRMFRKRESLPEGVAMEGPVYCCQEDGMIGLGAGARSYTKEFHYCTEYAVGRNSIDGIIDDYIARSREEHGRAIFGCRLTGDEQKRRFVLKSLLRDEGLVFCDYKANFGSRAMADFPQLNDLVELELAEKEAEKLRLNDAGMERSDTVGPWLFSAKTVHQMEIYDLV